MTKHTQRKLIELIDTIAEAVNHSINALLSQALDLTVDCYEATIALSSNFDTLSKERQGIYKPLIQSLLDNIVVLNNCFDDGKNAETEFKLIISLIADIRNKLLNEPDVKKEIVFLPYKASMWDSFDTIWRAAKNDPYCNVTVISIPYYEQTNKGREYKCEEKLFPEYVTVTNHREADLEAVNPDVIYIHNPYDNDNILTSVDPKYYSEQLKKFCSLLVYIPYFMSDRGLIDQNFIYTKGVYNSDLIIVQNNTAKKCYSDILPKEISDKVIAIGSPKLERALLFSQNTDTFSIPNGWKEKIAGKKVFFFNTTISSILIENEREIIKMQYVIDKFKFRDDAVLLWRPHPLSEATYAVMRPELNNLYMYIVSQFKQEGIGIFDETPDPHIGMAVSDAYIGDDSSLVQLYEATGKPVIIVDENNLCDPTHEEINSLAMHDAVIHNGFMYFSASNTNGLYRRNLESGCLEFLGEFPGEREDAYILHIRCTLHNDKIYFSPYTAKCASVYDIEKKSFSSILLKKAEREQFDNIKFCGDLRWDIYKTRFHSVISVSKYVVFLPAWSEDIVRYDTETGETAYFSEWKKTVFEYIKKMQLLFTSVIVKDNSLFLFCGYSDIVMEIQDIESFAYRFHYVKNAGNSGFLSVVSRDNMLYMLSSQKNIILKSSFAFDNITAQKKISYNEEQCEKIMGAFSTEFNHLVDFNGRLWLIPNIKGAKRIVAVSYNLNPVKEYDLDKILAKHGKNTLFLKANHSNSIVCPDGLFVLPLRAPMLKIGTDNYIYCERLTYTEREIILSCPNFYEITSLEYPGIILGELTSLTGIIDKIVKNKLSKNTLHEKADLSVKRNVNTSIGCGEEIHREVIAKYKEKFMQ